MKAIKLNPKPKTNTTYGQFKELMTMLRIAKNEGNLNSNNYRNAFRKNFESVIETDIENTTENKGSYDTDRNFYKALRAKNIKAIATLWHEIYDKGDCRW
jgi:predicted nucleic acid-binding protein